MNSKGKVYYFLDGRLDLSTLNEGNNEVCGQTRKGKFLSNHKSHSQGIQTPILESKDVVQEIYTDGAINNILKEMGEYFSGLN